MGFPSQYTKRSLLQVEEAWKPYLPAFQRSGVPAFRPSGVQAFHPWPSGDEPCVCESIIIVWNKVFVGLWFSTNLPRIRNLFFWIHQSLSLPYPLWFINPCGISATHNMKSSGDQMFRPREDYVHQIPSLPGRKGVKCPGYTLGGDVKTSIWLVYTLISICRHMEILWSSIFMDF